MRPSLSISVALADFAADATRESSAHQRMDEAAFQRMYREVAPGLRAYIRRAAGDATLADDILQDTFYKFLRANLPAMEPFHRKAYLYRIASSLLVDHWRKIKRERRWSLERWMGRDSVEHAAHTGDTMDAFEQLKPPERSLLWLAYVEGFTHREIAEVMELQEKSVRVLLFRARQKLADVLRKQGRGPGVQP
jgi:RNA polymerase sigma-70 factor (ECF subfamily)